MEERKMSYGFKMNFIQCKSKSHALDKIHEINELYYSYMEQVIEDNECWIPSIKYNITSDKEARSPPSTSILDFY